MKKAVITAIVLFFALGFTNAQELAWSKVINLKAHDITLGTATTDTVPAGKVWKVTSVSLTGFEWHMVHAPGVSSFMGGSNAIPVGDNSQNPSLRGVVWLKEGEVIQMIATVSSNRYFFSILEFDVGQ